MLRVCAKLFTQEDPVYYNTVCKVLEGISKHFTELTEKSRNPIMNIGILIIAIVGGATGLLSTAYLAISFPAVLLWKLYRRVVHRIPLTQ